MTKTSGVAFITGINGQDGSYLTELLLEKGYEVHGTLRRGSVFTTERIDHLLDHPALKTYHGDVTDSSNLNRLITSIKPSEIYNLAAQSHVAVSFEVPEYTADASGVAAIRLLDAIQQNCPDARFYQASTSELFGGLPETAPQTEATPFYPKSPYGAAKLYAYWVTVNYREAYDLFACNGILFNHESPRRGKTFVTRKITSCVGRIAAGSKEILKLGNLDSLRDWGHAKDYVNAMWLMLQSNEPKDYVVATGRTETVRRFCELAFSVIGVNLQWDGVGVDEKAYNERTGDLLIEVDPKYFRPSEVDLLHGNPAKIQNELGWCPKYDLESLVAEMVEHDFDLAKKQGVT